MSGVKTFVLGLLAGLVLGTSTTVLAYKMVEDEMEEIRELWRAYDRTVPLKKL